MFTGLGKKQADTDLEMVVQGGMMSQKAKEGGKSVFYLPVMSSFFCWVSCLQRSLTGNIWQRHHWNQELVFGERERSGHEYITFPCEWLGPSMNTLLTVCAWVWGENPMAGPFELEFGFLGQRQQLDEISAWTRVSLGIERPWYLLSPEYGTVSAAVKSKRFSFLKPLLTLCKQMGFTTCRVHLLPTLHFVHHVLKIIWKYIFSMMADYFLWFLYHSDRCFYHIFLLLHVQVVWFLIIMVGTDGDLQAVTGVSVLPWCPRHSAAVKDGAHLHQLQWCFTCLQKDPNHLFSI